MAGPTSTQKAGQALQKDLSTTARQSGDTRGVVIGRRTDTTLVGNVAIVPSQYRRYSPAELYQRFLINAPDHKGNYSCGFGQYGRRLSVAASFDFGDLILPGVVSAPVGAEVTGGLSKEVLFMIHRAAPNTLYVPDGNGQVTAFWKTPKSVCFSILSGKIYKLVAKIEASLEIGTGFTIGGAPSDTPSAADAQPEMAALSLDVELKAALSASGGLSGELMRLSADQISFYPDGTGDEIVTAFANALGGPSTKSLEAEVVGWCQYVIEYVTTNDPITAKQLLGELDAKLSLTDKIKALVQENIMETALSKIQDANVKTLAQNLLDYLQNKINNRPSTNQQISTMLDETATFFQQKMLASNTTPTQPANQGWVRATPQKVQVEFRELQKQIAWYKQLLNSSGGQSGNSAGPEPLEQLLCFADLYSFETVAQIGGTASGTGGVNTGAGTVGGGGSAGAKVAGDAKFTSSRYQTCVPSKSPVLPRLVITQDTMTTYRRIQGQATWAANIELPDYGLDASKQGELSKMFFDLITYQSITAYWSHPKTIGATPLSAPLRMGSGTSFGCSVNFGRLQNIALATTPAGSAQAKADARLLQKIATALHVRVETLKTFLTKAFAPSASAAAAANDPLATLDNYRTVILEANYAFNNLPNIDLKKDTKKNVYSAPDLISAQGIKTILTTLNTDLKNPPPAAPNPQASYRLDSIRFRVRNEDNLGNYDNSKPIFELGFDFRAAINLTYSKTEKASGNEGILDVYTCWFDPAYEASPKDGFERSVPSAVLLPHSLFEKGSSPVT